MLTPEEQEQVWSWLVKGASPQVACQQLGLSLPAFWRTLEGDVAFATALQQLFDTLSHNVLAALYRAAMEGNVTAQQFWLRHRPARAWQAPAVSELTDDPANFADAELLERAFAEGADIPPEVASCLSATGRPERVPRSSVGWPARPSIGPPLSLRRGSRGNSAISLRSIPHGERSPVNACRDRSCDGRMWNARAVIRRRPTWRCRPAGFCRRHRVRCRGWPRPPIATRRACSVGRLRDLVRQLPEWLPDLVPQKEAIVNRRTGSRLDMLSSDVNSSWGHLPDFVICDELCHWPHPDLWYSLCSSAAKKPACVLTVLTNAGHGTGWQWTVRETARTAPDWHFSSLHGSCAPWITAAALDEQRRLLPPGVFARLWMNEWQHSAGGFVTLEEAEACRDGTLSMQSRGGRRGVVVFCGGVDLMPRSTIERWGSLCIARATGSSSIGWMSLSRTLKFRSRLMGRGLAGALRGGLSADSFRAR